MELSSSFRAGAYLVWLTRSKRAWLAAIALAFPNGCGVDPSPLRLASPDKTQFVESAYPVLLRDCGFPACHGAQDRFFRIYGPGRSRLSAGKDDDPGDPQTDDEVSQSYERARSMIDARNPQQSLLLRKPLASKAGGAGHKGADAYGRNVYLSVQDPNYQLLRNWVFSISAAPTGTQEAAP